MSLFAPSEARVRLERMRWFKPWREVCADSGEFGSLQDELLKQLCEAHPLRALRPRIVGRRARQDDVVVELEDGRYAVVRLSRSLLPGVDGTHLPESIMFASFDQFTRECMRPDAQEYAADWI